MTQKWQSTFRLSRARELFPPGTWMRCVLLGTMLSTSQKTDMAREPIANKVDEGRKQKQRENEANPEMHATKNSMRRKGLSEGKIFSGALRQAERYNAKNRPSSRVMTSNGSMVSRRPKVVKGIGKGTKQPYAAAHPYAVGKKNAVVGAPAPYPTKPIKFPKPAAAPKPDLPDDSLSAA